MNKAVRRNMLVLTLAAAAVAGALLERQGTGRADTVSVAALGPEAADVETGPEAGLRAPGFSLSGKDGTVYSVGGPREKAVLVNFWASWCDPCKEEAPELNRIAETYAGTLDIYGVNVTSYDYKGNAERFVRKYGLTFPVMYDTDGSIYGLYQGSVFPTSVLIDTNGVVAEVFVGGLTEERVEKALRKLDMEPTAAAGRPIADKK